MRRARCRREARGTLSSVQAQVPDNVVRRTPRTRQLRACRCHCHISGASPLPRSRRCPPRRGLPCCQNREGLCLWLKARAGGPGEPAWSCPRWRTESSIARRPWAGERAGRGPHCAPAVRSYTRRPCSAGVVAPALPMPGLRCPHMRPTLRQLPSAAHQALARSRALCALIDLRGLRSACGSAAAMTWSTTLPAPRAGHVASLRL